MKFKSRRNLGQLVRLVGRRFEDVSQELQEVLQRLFAQVQGGIPGGYNSVTPEVLDPNTAGSAGSETSGWAAADHVHQLDLLLTTLGSLLTHTGSAYVALPVGAEALALTSAPSQPSGLQYGPIVLSPAQIVANQNDYAPGRANVYRVSSDASRNVTGLVAGTDGEVRYFLNAGSFNVVLTHDDSNSGAANRFICPNAVSLTLEPGDMALLLYDATTARWRAFLQEGGTLAPPVGWNNNWWGPPVSMYFG